MFRRISSIIVMISVIFLIMIANSKELRAEAIKPIPSGKVGDFSRQNNSAKSPNVDRLPRFEAYNPDIISHGFNKGRQGGDAALRNMEQIWDHIKD